MSYTILYDRQFILTGAGSFIPCVLVGDSNCYETALNGHKSRVRYWQVFNSFLGVTHQELMGYVETFPEDAEIWMRKGNWLYGKNLPAWVKNGCKGAALVEDIIADNGIPFIPVSIVGSDGGTYCSANIETTEKLDDWLVLAKQTLKALKRAGVSSFVDISFCTEEPLRHFPKRKTPDYSKALIRRSKGSKYFLAETPQDDRSVWTTVIQKALCLPTIEAMELLEKFSANRSIKAAVLTDAAILNAPHNAVIRMDGKGLSARYFVKRTRGRIYHSAYQSDAKHFPSMKEAEAAVERLTKTGHFGFTFVAELDPTMS